MSRNNFYITTPIYYANDKPHIGHAYTTILADVLSRYHRLMGHDVYFLTGTDEHGQKVQQAAEQRGITPKEQVDEFHQRFKDLWKTLNIKHNRFIRTTDEDHKKYVQKSLQELYDKGEIYIKEYGGWYSVGEERFLGEDEIEDGKDKVSGRPVEWVEEKNYFFKMGSYQERLLEHIEKNPDFILPEFRKNEILGFLKKPLQDLCISRPKSRLSWGITLPFDEDFVTYVWFDALLNYESGPLDFKFASGEKAWPADYHIIGKDIVTTHAVYWPTMLLGMGRELPRHILAHGWWVDQKGEKGSKTKGNVVDPMDYIPTYGVDTVRYFLMRNMVVGQDSTFTDRLFETRINTELANDLGNGVNRVSKFARGQFENKMPAPGNRGQDEEELKNVALEVKDRVLALIEEVKISQAIEEVGRLVRSVNKYLEVRAPWKVAKQIEPGGDKGELGGILYTSGEAIRIALCLLYPVMPTKTIQGLSMLGIESEPVLADLDWGILKGGENLPEAEALFPRIEIKSEGDTQMEDQEAKTNAEKKEKPAKQKKQGGGGQTPVDPASKLDLRVSEIIAVEDHPEAEKLFKLTINTGEDERTVCAGLKDYYRAEEILNRKVVLVANLKPAKLRGVESRGMVLAAEGADNPDEHKAVILDPGEIPVGTTLGFGDLEVIPKSKLGKSDFDKVPMVVRGGEVVYGEHKLGHNGQTVRCPVSDNAEVR